MVAVTPEFTVKVSMLTKLPSQSRRLVKVVLAAMTVLPSSERMPAWLIVPPLKVWPPWRFSLSLALARMMSGVASKVTGAEMLPMPTARIVPLANSRAVPPRTGEPAAAVLFRKISRPEFSVQEPEGEFTVTCPPSTIVRLSLKASVMSALMVRLPVVVTVWVCPVVPGPSQSRNALPNVTTPL